VNRQAEAGAGAASRRICGSITDRVKLPAGGQNKLYLLYYPHLVGGQPALYAAHSCWHCDRGGSMKRKATAVWRGGGKDGQGVLTTPSGALREQPYSARLRFESESGREGTNPEELIAAAEAGCFSMALSFQLSGAGYTAEQLTTDAELTMEKEDIGWTIRSIRLKLRGQVPGISEAQFHELAEKAKAGCPVSRLLKADIQLDAQLMSTTPAA
jgi:osmotically inducible protein OsmC